MSFTVEITLNKDLSKKIEIIITENIELQQIFTRVNQFKNRRRHVFILMFCIPIKIINSYNLLVLILNQKVDYFYY